MTSQKLGSFRLLMQALRLTGFLFPRVLISGALLLIPLHLVQAGASQFLAYCMEYLRNSGREDLLFIAMIAALELVFTLLWSAAWMLAIAQKAESELVRRPAPKFFVSMIRYFNQLVIEQIRAMAAVLWRVPLLIFPALVQYIRLSFVPFVVVFSEAYDRGDEDALHQSRRLSRGHFWLLAVTIAVSFGLPWFLEEVLRGEQGPWIWENPLGVSMAWVATFFVSVVFSVFLFALFRTLVAPPVQTPEPETASLDLGPNSNI